MAKEKPGKVKSPSPSKALLTSESKIHILQRALDIEAALDQVRTRTMAMQRSEELSEVASLLFQQMTVLGLKPLACGFGILNQKNFDQYFSVDSKVFPNSLPIPYDINSNLRQVYEAWEKGEKLHFHDLQGHALKEHSEPIINYLRSIGINLPEEATKRKKNRQVDYHAFFKHGCLLFSYDHLVEDTGLFLRFANVFDLTYTRFLDLKKAEQQAREAQIEAALERIRSTSLAMRKSEEIREVVRCVFESLEDLGFDLERAAAIILIFIDGSKDHFEWITDPTQTYPQCIRMPYLGNSLISDIWQARETGVDFYSKTYSIKAKNDFFNYVLANTGYSQIPDFKKQEILNAQTYSYSAALERSSGLAIPDMTGKIYSGESKEIMKRFAKAFDQAYTRFQDLQMAEEQAREAQIEAALERVRSRALAMHKSDELNEVIAVLYEQTQLLQIGDWGCSLNIFNDAEDYFDTWQSLDTQRLSPQSFRIARQGHPVTREHWEIWKCQEQNRFIELKGQIKTEYDDYLFSKTGFKLLPQSIKQSIRSISDAWACIATMKHGTLNCYTSKQPLSESDFLILQRFAKVFEQAYTRFLDLQKAEAQAREAQIEAALERVRSSAMAMHSPGELKKVVIELRKQIGSLGVKELETCAIHLYEDSSEYFISWTASQSPSGDSDLVISETRLPKKGVASIEELVDGYTKNKQDYVVFNDARRLKEFLKMLKVHAPETHKVVLTSLKGVKKNEIKSYWAASDFKGGSLSIATFTMPDEESRSLLRRFANVFGMAYQRFRDLQKAEAQAREAQIEAALERVRARTMAMHKSEELRELVFEFYKQIHPFGFAKWGFEIKIAREDKSGFYCWISPPGARVQPEGFNIPTLDHWVLKKYWSVYEQQIPVTTIVNSGADKRKLAVLLLKKSDMKNLPEDVKTNIMETEYDHFSVAAMRFGLLKAVDMEEIQEKDYSILPRFAKVFEQTYTRFLDLKKAEDQAREAQIEASLERIRASTMAMHNSEDLVQVADTLKEQMGLLGQHQLESAVIEFYDLHEDYIESWFALVPAAQIDGKKLTGKEVFRKDACAFLRDLVRMYESPQKEYTLINKGKKHQDFIKVLSEKIPEFATVKLPDQMYYSCADFTGGTLLVATVEEPSKKTKELLSRASKVFDLAYLRFLDLKKAEEQAREAKIETSLERVRSRTMAMHQSNELTEVVEVLYREVGMLGIADWGCNIQIFHPEENSIEIWLSEDENKVFDRSFFFRGEKHPGIQLQWNAFRDKTSHFTLSLEGSSKISYDNYVLEHTDFKYFPEKIKKGIRKIPRVHFNYSYMTYGYIVGIHQSSPFSEQQFALLGRFAKVFEQTYTRFLDLQKAEAQAREAQVETALERVRSRTMAMHTSHELKEVVGEFFRQVQSLGIEIQMFVIFIFKPDGRMEWWGTEFGAEGLPQSYEIPSLEAVKRHPRARNLIDIRENSTPYQVFELAGQEKKSWDQFLLEETELEKLPAQIKKGMTSLEKIVLCDAVCDHGILEVAGQVALSNEHAQILQRFAKVFSQTYTRFLDVQKAEIQAREAEIQLGLERVRARTMAMHKSAELNEVAILLYHELRSLGIGDFFNCGYVEVDEEQMIQYSWMTKPDGTSLAKHQLPLVGDTVLQDRYDNWQKQKKVFHQTVSGSVLKEHVKFVSRHFGNQEVLSVANTIPDPTIFYCGNFQYGYLHILSACHLSPESESLLARFAQVFEQTYTRFLDLQRAEAQAREAEIQLALERVRARTMAMHHGDELADTALVLFDQLIQLGFKLRGCGFLIMDEPSNTMEDWSANLDEHGEGKIVTGTLAFDIHPILEGVVDTWRRGQPYYIGEVHGTELQEYYRVVTLNESVSQEIKEKVLESAISEWTNSFYFEYGMMYALTPQSLGAEEINVLLRFASVFKDTYRRFLDLRNAEAQAREAEIQLALERVRARTMAMHKSEELGEVARTLYTELQSLGFTDFINCGFIDIDEESNTQRAWGTLPGAEPQEFFLPLGDEPVTKQRYQAWKNGEPVLYQEVGGESLKRHIEYVMPHLGSSEVEEMVKNQFTDPTYFYSGNFSHGYLFVVSTRAFDEEQISLIRKFTSAFGLAYLRFLDLKRAEEQAREANIEAALERVRASSMAMHKSEDINDVLVRTFKEFTSLGVQLTWAVIWIYQPKDRSVTWWSAQPEAESGTESFDIRDNDNIVYNDCWEAWEERKSRYYYELSGNVKNAWDDHLFSKTGLARLPKMVQAAMREPDLVHLYNSYQDFGAFFVGTLEPINDQDFSIVERFAIVFQQAWTRFNDIRKAEAQAREAQIEAAMERIRSRSLAMRSSEEIMEVITEIRRQIDTLGQLDLEASVVHIYSEESNFFESIAAVRPPGESGEIVLANVFFPVNAMPRIEEMIANYHSDINEYTLEFDREMAEAWQQVMVKYAPMIAERRVGFVENRRISEHSEFWNFADFSDGSLLLVTHSPASEDTKTVLRKASQVFDLAYRRYRDLQKAEARTKEAIKQASLDRVRGEIASMRNSEDLNRITPLIWRELQALEVPFIRCGVFIIDREMNNVEVYLTSPDGKALAALHFTPDANTLTSETVRHWRKKQLYKVHWNQQDFINWTRSMIDTGQVQDAETYQGARKPPESLDLHFVPFRQGMLYVGDIAPLAEDKLDLVKTLAEAFSIAYARYEDFKKLEDAKAKIEEAFGELKATQSQLIQSEKMASLGELTAGIAHEIQNPLNFVNNFSEVNSELIDEMKMELEKGNYNEAKEISNDIKINEEKIKHHGRRADAIVKSMLQHSRMSSGKKELTDINALCDEYLRLAYHGFRARDKSFNADFKMDLDPDLPRIQVLPQDIGRVLLNLINNAFQACTERSRSISTEQSRSGTLEGASSVSDTDYKPLVSISTRVLDSQVQIQVTDNGPGIPDHIRDKIFQPFFTTKPTGQGTGLGLSLSYDIITKGHGGDITFESEVGKGSVFKIYLTT